MPPMGQGEDPNDPERPLTHDEREKLKMMETLSIRESMNILDLPNDALRNIFRHIKQSYVEDRENKLADLFDAQVRIELESQKHEIAQAEHRNNPNAISKLQVGFAADNLAQARQQHFRLSTNYDESVQRTAFILTVYHRMLNINKIN